MRLLFPLTVLVTIPAAAPAQDPRAAEQAETLLYILNLHDRESGGFKPDAKGKPGLRATSAAVRALKYNGVPLKPGHPIHDKAAGFVMSCYDPKTGGFADTPGGKPDVPTTAVGVMAAVELGVPKEKFAKAMDYVKENAKTFEEVRIAAAAVEAWGVKDVSFDFKPWLEVADDWLVREMVGRLDDCVREHASVAAMRLRLGFQVNREAMLDTLNKDRQADGGWARHGAKGSDLETVYRVMRAFYLLKAAPKDAAKLREFVAKCRNKDDGYGVTPGAPSSVGGTYYAAIITHWLDELEKK